MEELINDFMQTDDLFKTNAQLVENKQVRERLLYLHKHTLQLMNQINEKIADYFGSADYKRVKQRLHKWLN